MTEKSFDRRRTARHRTAFAQGHGVGWTTIAEVSGLATEAVPEAMARPTIEPGSFLPFGRQLSKDGINLHPKVIYQPAGSAEEP